MNENYRLHKIIAVDRFAKVPFVAYTFEILWYGDTYTLDEFLIKGKADWSYAATFPSMGLYLYTRNIKFLQ